MPQAFGQKQYQSFVRGLITEDSEINFPVDASVDEDNCILSRDGSRKRRLGVDRETSANLTADINEAQFSNGSIVVYKWRNVAGTAARTFAVVQVGSVLRFHDLGADPITQKNFTVNLSSYRYQKATVQPETEMCDFTSGKGVLFVVSKAIDPIRVEYEPASDTISVSRTTLKVRDFEGVEDDLEVDEEPATLSKKHEYNLTNQGWVRTSTTGTNPITTFFNSTGRYPGNNKQWHAGKNESTGNLDVDQLNKLAAGTSQAPRGHWLISPLTRDLAEREKASEILDLDDRTFPAKITGTVPTVAYTPNANTLLLAHCDEDTGTGSTDDSSATDHDIDFVGTASGGGGTWSHQSAVKIFGSNALRKLRGNGSAGSSRLNFNRASNFEWGEFINDQDSTLECFFRLDDLQSDDPGPLLEDRLVFWAYWDEFSNDRGWLWDWWPTAYSYSPTARDQGNTGPAGFSFAYSPDGSTIYRLLPSVFPYQLAQDIWYYLAFTLDQSTRKVQAFIQPYADLIVNFGISDFPLEFLGEATLDNNGYPVHESVNNMFFGSENNATGTGSWQGYVDEIRMQKEIVIQGFDGTSADIAPSAPAAVEFFAGRVAYAGGGYQGMAGRVLLSPVLERASQAGDCYQAGDPTAEVNSDLVDSDGADILVDGMGECKRLFNLGTALLCLADNGVWAITGTEGTGFRATGFEVNKLSSSGILGARSLVDAGGKPFWWGEEGIFTVGQGANGSVEVQNLSLTTMQGFYDGNDNFTAIPSWSKEYVSGTYDQKNKRVIWFYRGTDAGTDTYRHKYDKALCYDNVLAAFYPWSISSLVSNTPYIAGAIATGGVGLVEGEVNVADDADLVLDNSSTQIVVTRDVLTGRDLNFKVLVVEPGTGVSNYTWGEFSDTNFEDWATKGGGAGSGADFTSFAQAGYEIGESFGSYKWAPRILTACRRGLNNECTMQARWEWADATASGKFSTGQNIYLANNLDTDGSAGFPIIISQKKLRGRGHALSVRYTSVAGKDFELVGWALEIAQNQRMS